MVGYEKALRAVKVIKDQIQYRSERLLNLARGYFSYELNEFLCLDVGDLLGLVSLRPGFH